MNRHLYIETPYHWASKDKTVIQLENEDRNIETNTFYAVVRALESKGFTQIKASLLKLERDGMKKPGAMDEIKVTNEKDAEFNVTTLTKERKEGEKVTAKTIFTYGNLTRTTFPTHSLQACFRFRFEKVGKVLKPIKPVIISSVTIRLSAGKPKEV